jgi:hypothetical protein
MIDKRAVERFDLNLEAYVLANGEPFTNQPQVLTTRDVSMNGAYLLTDKPFPIGTEVKIDVILPLESLMHGVKQKALIKACGSVLRTDSEGMAIRFDENSKFLPFSEDKLVSI